MSSTRDRSAFLASFFASRRAPPPPPRIIHPKELTREAIESWLEVFRKKLKRTTSRDDLDRLILSVERMDFRKEDGSEMIGPAGWTEVIFEKQGGKIKYFRTMELELQLTEFQKKILARNPDLEGRQILRSELKRETGEWILDSSLEKKQISVGGEAIVFSESFGELEVAVRVQCFDSALFTGEKSAELHFEIQLSEEYEIAKSYKTGSEKSNPVHENVVKNFSNIEIFLKEDEKKEDCLGWITVMEKCESDLRKRLKEESLDLEERKKIAIGVVDGEGYLKAAGIRHLDGKPENILLKDGVPKWSDFGIISGGGSKGEKGYRQMAYSRKGSRYRGAQFLRAGTPAFTQIGQLVDNTGNSNTEFAVHVWTLCDWKTAWSLLFKPIEADEREAIKKELESFNAQWLSKHQKPRIDEINGVSKIISLKNVSSAFILDSNLTKSKVLANWKAQYTRQINNDFKNLTKNVVDQKETNLCVPISVSSLLRWAIKNDLGANDNIIFAYFSMEKVLTALTMIVYPRSLAGLDLNPKKEEQNFQHTEIELLLKRLKFETYLDKRGWDFIDENSTVNADFDFEQVLLHEAFTLSRPLTVTGAFLPETGGVFFHQMVIDRIENSEYVLQNTALDHSGSQIRIPLDRPYYAKLEMMYDCYSSFNAYVYKGANNEFLKLVNENLNMKKKVWYLLPQAYSVKLTRKTKTT